MRIEPRPGRRRPRPPPTARRFPTRSRRPSGSTSAFANYARRRGPPLPASCHPCTETFHQETAYLANECHVRSIRWHLDGVKASGDDVGSHAHRQRVGGMMDERVKLEREVYRLTQLIG